MIIGWRGAPNLSDEPQHLVTGRITRSLLNLLGIKYCILEKDNDFKKLNNLIKHSKNIPIACLIKNKTLKSKYKFSENKTKNNFPTKAETIKILLENIKKYKNYINNRIHI